MLEWDAFGGRREDSGSAGLRAGTEQVHTEFLTMKQQRTKKTIIP